MGIACDFTGSSVGVCGPFYWHAREGSPVRLSKEKRERRLVRTRQRQPDFVRKAGPHDHRPARQSRKADIVEQLEEWAADYDGTHSVFED